MPLLTQVTSRSRYRRRLLLGDHARRAGAVGDFLREVVALAELLAHDLHNVVGVAVVLGKDQGLRDLGAPGEDLREQPLFEGANDGPDLVLATTSRSSWLEPLYVKLSSSCFPAHLARQAVALVHFESRIDGRAMLADQRADAIDVEIDVDAYRPRPARGCTP
jgi:hypothetical protein